MRVLPLLAVGEKTSNYPKLRISEANQNRMVDVLRRANNTMSKIDFANAMLTECLDMIEDKGAHLKIPPTVQLLRARLGLKSFEEADRELLQNLLDRMKEVEERVRITPEPESARVAETPPRKRKRA